LFVEGIKKYKGREAEDEIEGGREMIEERSDEKNHRTEGPLVRFRLKQWNANHDLNLNRV
jgi:hypothetical protein